MSARVLVVDDQESNRRLLHARLASEYYQVQLAASGAEALERVRTDRPDVILLDVMMPGLDGYEVCRMLKADPRCRHIPVLMVTALDERDARIRALEAGAEDYLTKPIDEVQLMARLRSALRLKPVLDELRAREASGRRIGWIAAAPQAEAGDGARILLIDHTPDEARAIESALGGANEIFALELDAAAPARPDLIIVSIARDDRDGLRIIAHIRAEETTRRLAVLAIANAGDVTLAMRALDLGADDIVLLPLDVDELRARVRTLMRRKRHLETMSAALDEGLEAAMTDPLTGLGNRRSLEAKLAALLRRAAAPNQALSVLIADIDHFKAVNDTHGHAIGDALLHEFAARLARLVRPLDVVCRYGGEEFLIVMPGASGDLAALAAERLRKRIAANPFPVSPTQTLSVTASFGVAAARPGDEVQDLIQRADGALYRAKAEGRNRVLSAA